MTIQCFSIRNFAYDTQKTYNFDTNCYFVIYQQFLHGYFRALQQRATASQKYIFRLRFLPPLLTLMDLSGNKCFLQRVQKVTSVGCNWFVSIHVVYFVSW